VPRLLLALLAALALFFPTPASAEERILHFLSDVSVQRDGSLAVTEMIRIRAEGDQIKRGIFRDFPTRYRTGAGRELRVGFEVEGVERDGRPEPWTRSRLSNGVRIRIGDADVMLPPGEHEYSIRYRTTRQIGHFDQFDELYWNATGTGWAFPIDRAEARIRLPEPAPFGDRAVYTGPQGATRQYAEVVSERPGEILFRTTAPLAANEGLTIAVAWPKGIVAEPSAETKAGWWIRDKGPVAVALLGLLGVLAYYFYAWRRAGRGPEAGTMVPVFAPPEGMSAAAVRYVSKMGFDNRAFSAALVQCGVRGALRLREEEGGLFSSRKMTIEKRQGSEPLSPAEAEMVEKLFQGRDSILMDDVNHATFRAASSALEKALKKAYEGTYFLRNTAYSAVGLGLVGAAVVVTAAMLAATDPEAAPGPAVAAPMIGILSLVVAVSLIGIMKNAATVGRCLLMLVIFILFSTGLFSSFITIVTAAEGGRLLPMLVPLVALPVAISAFWWMAAPTRKGRALMDRIEGFRHYLSVAEEDRLETMHPPEETPELFERYLPYAIALKVENAWASRFTAVLAAAAAAGRTHTMGWYSGNGNAWSDPADFVDRVGSTLASTVSSASTAPGSSSGSSGGGSSGGGGGGGGGGGW
jgi:uncharacterized membrane protein YgcG